MHRLAATLVHLIVLAQHAVHGGDRGQVDPVIEQLVVDRGGRLVDVFGTVEHLPHPGTLLGRQRPRLGLTLPPRPLRRRGLAVAAVVAGLRPPYRPAGRAHATGQRGQVGDRSIDHGVGSLPLLVLSVASCSNRAESFP